MCMCLAPYQDAARCKSLLILLCSPEKGNQNNKCRHFATQFSAEQNNALGTSQASQASQASPPQLLLLVLMVFGMEMCSVVTSFFFLFLFPGICASSPLCAYDLKRNGKSYK